MLVEVVGRRARGIGLFYDGVMLSCSTYPAPPGWMASIDSNSAGYMGF